MLAALYIVLAVYQLYLNQWLQIRWRRWMTQSYLGDWLDGANHYRMQLLGDAADNPDQRIAEDIQLFVDSTLISIGIGLLSSIVTLARSSSSCGTCRRTRRCICSAASGNIPGYLVWAALIYAVDRHLFTHLIGRPLIALNFHQQRFEADFRFNLVRVRENSEQIALLDGEPAETRAPARALRPRGRQLAGHHDAAEAAHLLHAGYCAGLDRVSLSSWSARPISPARCSSAG